MAAALPTIPPATLQAWLADGGEIALLDVREAGQFGEGHLFFAVPIPYSLLERDALRLVPRRDTRIVLVDADDGVAPRAARRLVALGYSQVHMLAGGTPGWAAAGHTLFQGVNVPSKTFGELVEHAYGTPHISPAELQRRQASGEPLILLDGRTYEEHRKMTIPGAVSVPNGELALCWHALAATPSVPIVIHCAGRTRSIIGAQILRGLGVPNPVMALENGTQGWALAGLELEHGSTRQASLPPPAARPEDQAAAKRWARDAGAPALTPSQAQAWLDDVTRTTYLLDVRSSAEFMESTLAGAVHAPGGQLLQANDQTMGVRGARILLLDDEDVRAPVIAGWLRRMGWEAATVVGGIHAALRTAATPHTGSAEALPRIAANELAHWVRTHHPLLIDLQPSMAYRRSHAQHARWSIRPRIVADAGPADARPLLLLAPDAGIASRATLDLREAGWTALQWSTNADWEAAGLPTQESPAEPSDANAIDYLFFVHDRHDGNLAAARRYLAWETGLIAQCTPDELTGFHLP